MKGTSQALMAVGGFPEPFLGQSEQAAKRWRVNRRDQVLRQDLRDLTQVREVALVEQLVDLLTERVGAPLSMNSLREDLQVHHHTIGTWLEILERLYVVFRVRPYAGSLSRALHKEPKVYFWDWTEVTNPGARFENLVASHLLKYCHWRHDVEGELMELRYVRDREKREVDFLLLKDRQPWVLIEAKLNDLTPSASLYYFKERLKVPWAFQVVSGEEARKDVVPVSRFFAGLP